MWRDSVIGWTRLVLLAGLFAGFGAAPTGLEAQVVLVDQRLPPTIPRPIPPTPRPLPVPQYRISSVEVEAAVVDQGAKVQVQQVFENTGSTPMEAVFVFPLPDEAAISDLTLMVDNQELIGKLHRREEARRIYEEIVRRHRDPALLEYVGQGLYQTSVFPIPPGGKRTVQIRYTQLLKREQGLVSFRLPFGNTRHSGRPIQRLQVTVRVESPEPLQALYSPSHTLEISRPDPRHAVCQLKLQESFQPDDFHLLFGGDTKAAGVRLLSHRRNGAEEGTFLLLASPAEGGAPEPPIARTLLFVVDKSGSMSGAKMEQARDGLRFLVRQLRPMDTFNIIAYESQVTLFRPELQVGDAASMEAALQWVDGLYAGGGTAIDGALKEAFRLATDPKRPTFVVFLTDGLPTVGEVQELKIAQNARQGNQVRARLFPFGVGFDVNARLLDRLAADHRGASSYVRPNENIEAGIATLYNRIGSPLLTDLQLQWRLEPALPPGAEVVNRTYPKQLTDLYRGEQLVYVGRYRQPGKVRVTLSGVRGAERVALDAEGELVAQSTDDSLIFVERLWATRRIGELIEQLDLEGRNPELIDELVQLSQRHGILTPYTSFLAEEVTALGASVVNRRETLKRLEEGLRRESGESGVEQRAFKGNLQRSTAAPAGGAGTGAAAGLGGEQKREVAQQLMKNAGRGTLAVDVNGKAWVATSVQTVGGKTFFRKQGVWRDSTVTDEQVAKARKVRQFSPEHFDLAAQDNGRWGRYLAFTATESVLVNLGDETWLVEPAADE